MFFEMLRDMITETMGCEESDVALGAELRDELGLSDGELSEIVAAMAHELGFRFDEIDLEEAATVRDLVRCISALL